MTGGRWFTSLFLLVLALHTGGTLSFLVWAFAIRGARVVHVEGWS